MILWMLFTMGAVHGLNADHLAAMSAVMFYPSSHKKTLWMAGLFSLCHLGTLLLLSFLVHGFQGSFPHAFEETARALSRMVLVTLAVFLLLDVFKPLFHKHPHSHSFAHHAYDHQHFHVHAFLKSHAHTHVPIALGGALAFSHARLFLAVVVLFQAQSAEWFYAPFFFGAGMFLSMMLAGIFFFLLHSSLKKATVFLKAAQIVSAFACVVTAAWMV